MRLQNIAAFLQGEIMSTIKIWHNPKCAKSREGVAIVQESDATCEVVKYLDAPLTKEEVKNVLQMLGFQSAREWMRTKEDIYKELDLKNESNEEKLIEAMLKHPKLIERPVIIKGNKAIVGRPSSLINEFLKA